MKRKTTLLELAHKLAELDIDRMQDADELRRALLLIKSDALAALKAAGQEI